MTLRDNIMAILESCFSGYREDLITNARDRIMAQVERQKPEKIFIEGIEYKRADTLKTDCAWHGDNAMCNRCGETDCAWREAEQSGRNAVAQRERSDY